jgi:hypothetical protein
VQGAAQRVAALLVVGAHAIRGAVDGDDDAAVEQSVEDGNGEHGVTESFAPSRRSGIRERTRSSCILGFPGCGYAA